MTEILAYSRATSAAEVFSAIDSAAGPVRLLAGGTDLLLKMKAGDSPPFTVVDISAVEALSGIQRRVDGLWIGATTKLRDIEQSNDFSGALGALQKGASLVGSPQIRNLATIGGNICNAAPSADTAAPLLVLDASVEIQSISGTRSIPLEDFFTGPGTTVLQQGEILSGFKIPEPPSGAAGVYFKQSPRKAMDLAVVGVGVLMARSNGGLDVRIALTAVSPTPMRVPQVEQMLAVEADLSEEKIQAAAGMVAKAAKPIDDVRASADYRREMVEILTARALSEAYQQIEKM